MCIDGACGRVTETPEVLCMGWDEALVMGALSAAGTAASANAQSNAAQSNNSSNMMVAAVGNAFNADEARKAREFNSGEADTSRTFSAQQAALQRQSALSNQMEAERFNSEQRVAGQDFNADQALKAQSFNASEAQKSRDYQTEMSNTAYQRAVGDMQKAGLNPMLAYSQGGAGTPSGATASGSGASSPGASVGPAGATSASSAQASGPAASGANVPTMRSLGGGAAGSLGVAMNSGFNAANQIADLQNKDANNKLITAQADKTAAEIPNTQLTGEKLQDDVNILKNTFQERVKGVKSDQDTKYNQADITQVQRSITEAELKKANGDITTQQLQQTYMKANNALTQMGIPGAENEAKFQEQMKTAPQYMKFLNMMVNSGATAARAMK